MNIRNIILSTLPAMVLSFVACSVEESDFTQPDSQNKVSHLSEDVLQGELFVKFHPSVSKVLEQAGLTKSGADYPASRSGVLSVDEILDMVDGYEIERVFPVDASTEENARHEGLHLWYIVRFGEDHPVDKVASDLARLGEVQLVEYNRTIKRANTSKAIPVTPQMLSQSVKASSKVPNDPLLKYQWHLVNNGVDQELPVEKPEGVQATFLEGADIGMKNVWENPDMKGHPSIIVAVLDEGVCFTHPDLAASMWVNEGEELRSRVDADGNGYKGDKHGYNFVQDTGVISTDSVYDTGHGSHVAGVIAAVNNNGIGISSIAGGTPDSPGVRIMSCQIFAGPYSGTLLDEVRAIKYAADNGAVILQCSWGYISGAANPYEWAPQFSNDDEWMTSNKLEKLALDYFINYAGSPDGVVEGGIAIFASGNEYAPAASYPAAYSDYVSVAATAPDFTPAVYSNYGKGVTISAPGGDQDYYYAYGEGHDKGFAGCVLSTIGPTSAIGFDEQISAGTEGTYAYMEGTSMACPHVSGVVALGLSYAAHKKIHVKAKDAIQVLYESVYKTPDGKDPFSEYWDYENPKVFYKYVSDLGQNHKKNIDLNAYKGKMGHGQANAYNFCKAIVGEGVGQKMCFPNIFVQEGDMKSYVPSLYMDGSFFSVDVKDSSVATAEYKDGKVYVKGLAIGQTKATLRSASQSQEFVITVRAKAGSIGWL